MPTLAAAIDSSQAKVSGGMDCRVWERYTCHLETQCQPIAARGSNEVAWGAKLKDVSAGGIGLVAVRRFEPGTGLAIQIPSQDDPDGATYLAKVVHVRKLDGGEWFLGMALISRLSEEEILRIVNLVPPNAGPTSTPPAHPRPPVETPEQHFSGKESRPCSQVISRIRWRNVATGDNRVAKRSLFKGSWPLRSQAKVKIRINAGPGISAPTVIVIHSCIQDGDEWIVDFSFLKDPTPQVAEWLQES